MLRCFFAAVAAAIVLCPGPGARGAQDPQREQRPVFRAGAHFVRVDAYPTRDGRPLRNLTADDFELLEDGKPQKVETFEYVAFEGNTPEAVRQDPNSQRDAFEQAKDPRYRVFVLYLDIYHVDVSGSHRLRQPIVNMLNRMLGPQDLFGVLTPIQSPKDLILARQSLLIQEQLTKYWYWGAGGALEPFDSELRSCFPFNRVLTEALVGLRRLDEVYADLEGLVSLLGDLREERKQIVLFSQRLGAPPAAVNLQLARTERPSPGGVGVDGQGKLTAGARNAGERDGRWCESELSRLTAIDFSLRFRDLLRHARQANVSFYPVRPGGLDPSDSLLSDGISNLLTLADQTDGLAIANSNDLDAGLQRVAADLSSYYVLGYYTSNGNWNGGTRRITVKLKSTGETIRARREYRAPTEAEMASIANARGPASAPAAPSPAAAAFDALARLRPGAPMTLHGTVTGDELTIVTELAAPAIEGGRWSAGALVDAIVSGPDGQTVGKGTGRIEPGLRSALVRVRAAGPGPWDVMVRVRGDGERPETDSVSVRRRADTLVGEPLMLRGGRTAASPLQPVAAFQFRRTERIRLEWPLLTAADAYEARLLDRREQPLAYPIATARAETRLTADINLAPLNAGDYLIELIARAGARTERQLVAIRVSMAR